MLAHCLECFKSMDKKSGEGLIPSKEVWLEWCLTNPKMVEDDEFIQVLFDTQHVVKFNDNCQYRC